MAKKKKKTNRYRGPRRKRYNREQRCQAFPKWRAQLHPECTNLIRAYAKYFAVSRVCAAIELDSMGVSLKEGAIEQERRREVAIGEANRKKREKRKTEQEASTYFDPIASLGLEKDASPFLIAALRRSFMEADDFQDEDLDGWWI